MQETSCFNMSVFILKEILTFFAIFAALREQVFKPFKAASRQDAKNAK